MNLLRPPPEVARAGLRAMAVVARRDGVLAPAAAAVIDAAQRNLLDTHLDVASLEPIAPAELTQAFGDPALARQFVQGLVLCSLADGVPSAERFAIVEGYAQALGVSSGEVQVIHELAAKHLLLFRLDFLRRSHIADMMKHQYQDQGLLGVAKGVLGLRGLVEDKELAGRYRAMASLPEGTLGRAFLDYIDRNHFSVPGEKGGFPEAGIYHDFSHVLSGYNTDSPGEMEVAAFVAGFKKENPFFVLLFVTLTFSAGVNVTPLPQPKMQGILGEPGMADRVFRALERGSRMSVDLSDSWDHWAWVAKPLEQARRELNIAP